MHQAISPNVVIFCKVWGFCMIDQHSLTSGPGSATGNKRLTFEKKCELLILSELCVLRAQGWAAGSAPALGGVVVRWGGGGSAAHYLRPGVLTPVG